MKLQSQNESESPDNNARLQAKLRGYKAANCVNKGDNPSEDMMKAECGSNPNTQGE